MKLKKDILEDEATHQSYLMQNQKIIMKNNLKNLEKIMLF